MLSFLGKSANWPCWFLCVCVCVCVCVYLCVTIFTTGHIIAKINNLKNDVYRFWHLPSNYIIAKIVLHDLDLLFEGQKCETSTSLKWIELAHKCLGSVFCEFWYLSAKNNSTKLYSMTLTYFLKVKRWNVNISEMVRDGAKLHPTAFTNFAICHRIVSLQKLYSWPWPTF